MLSVKKIAVPLDDSSIDIFYLKLVQPVSYWEEALLVGQIEQQQEAHRVSVERRSQTAEPETQSYTSV